MAKIPPLAKKKLTPVELGFGLTAVDAITLHTKATAALKVMKNNNTISPGVFIICTHILNESNKGLNKFTVPFSAHVTPQEAGIITSDFGEVSGALFMLRDTNNFTKAKFPTISNQALVDYYLLDSDGNEYPFSAKAGKGGKASITAVVPVIAKMKNLKGKEATAAKVLAHIGIEEKNEVGKSTGTDLYKGPLLAAEYLKFDSYRELINVVTKMTKDSGFTLKYTSGIPTAAQLLETVDNAGKWPDCSTGALKPFLDSAKKMGFEIKDETAVKRAINRGPDFKAHRDKPWGILHYPITANLIKWLNTPENMATSLLTRAANTLNVTQVRMYSKPSAMNPNSVEYSVSKFAESKFEFGSPSSTPNPVGNRIGLTMV